MGSSSRLASAAAAIPVLLSLLVVLHPAPASATLRRRRTGSFGVPPDTSNTFLIRLRSHSEVSAFSAKNLSAIVKTCPAGCSGAKSSEVQSEVDAFSDDDVQAFGNVRIVQLRGSTSDMVSISDMVGGDIEEIVPDSVIEIASTPSCSLPQSSPSAWGLDRVDQVDLPLDLIYDPDGGCNTAQMNIDAYILDTGIKADHEEFQGRATFGYTAYADETADGHGHGTHCAGTIGGKTVGIAPLVNLIGVKVVRDNGFGSAGKLIEGINWVIAQVMSTGRTSVMSISLAGNLNSAVNAAVATAVNDYNITTVVSAGNDATDACLYSPASSPDAITVGASNKNDIRAGFSNYASCLDIFAPGTKIPSAWATSTTATKKLSGTSMAAPHVSGAAVALLAHNSSMMPMDVRNHLLGTATMKNFDRNGDFFPGTPEKLLNVQDLQSGSV